MLNPDGPEMIFSEDEPEIVAYVDTDSGGLLITDSLWSDRLPEVTQKRFDRDLNLPGQRIPIKAFQRGGKRYLLIELDSGTSTIEKADVVTVEKEDEEEEKE